jgi:hypothetical protein
MKNKVMTPSNATYFDHGADPGFDHFVGLFQLYSIPFIIPVPRKFAFYTHPTSE